MGIFLKFVLWGKFCREVVVEWIGSLVVIWPSQLRVNPTRLNISLVLIKTHFSIRNSENFIKRRVADRWSQFLKSKISVFLSIQLLKISSNFSGLMSRVISTQQSRIMTIKKKYDDWDFVSLSRHLLTNMRTYAHSLFSFYSARELFWNWYGDHVIIGMIGTITWWFYRSTKLYRVLSDAQRFF